jgi:hypothetical protein
MTDKEHAAKIMEARDLLTLAIQQATKDGLEVTAKVDYVAELGTPPVPLLRIEIKRPIR